MSAYLREVKMPYKFGKRSLDRIATCHPAMAAVATRAIELTPVDFTIVHGWRGEEVQNILFESGASKLRWPKSKHNHTIMAVDSDELPALITPTERGVIPQSLALDFAPIIGGKIPWGDSHAFAVVAGVFFAAAKERGITLRWGGDWDRDGLTTDQRFMDWGHVELVI